MGLLHWKGEDKSWLLPRWRCTLGVLHAELGLRMLGLRFLGLPMLGLRILGLRKLGLCILGLRILGLRKLGAKSSELLSLLLPSSPQLEKSRCWLISSNNAIILGACSLAKASVKMLNPALDCT